MPRTSILTEYHAKRKELVDKDVSLRQDRAKYASMSDVERAAEEIVRRIRKEEALRVWSHEQDLFPGMAFLTGECPKA
jgi:adenosine deaminase CECR1